MPPRPQLAVADKPTPAHRKPHKMPAEPSTQKVTSPSCSGEAQFLLMESIAAHECILAALLASSAQLSANAWTKHKEFWAEIQVKKECLSGTVLHEESLLDAAKRRAQDVQVQFASSECAASQQDQVDTQAIISCKECCEHANRKMVHRFRALEALEEAKLEAEAEREHGKWLSEGARHAVVVRATTIVDRARQARTLVWLQRCLQITRTEYADACLAHGVEQSASTTNRMMISKARALKVHKELREQGRKRHSLQENEVLFFRSEIRRLLVDQDSEKERVCLLSSIANARMECDHVSSHSESHVKNIFQVLHHYRLC
mmetsp:Transcript_4719/g.15029  ORF Transcript_4719/g.15029 Transcript_4719/m.15029 type:complete len:318 (+) Transcript_4719:626-1579(+)